jgi:hypothetical protein
MGLLQRLIKGGSIDKQEFKAKFKQAQMEDKISRTVEERKMSANERELLSYQKQMREDDIKKELDKIHQKQTKDNWKSNSMINSQKRILKNDRPILKEKNIFKNNKSLFLKKGKLC